MELVETSSTIQSNWKELNLGDSAILKARIGWQGLTTAEYLDTGNYYLITGTDFKNGFIDWDNCVFVEKNRYDQDRNIQVQVGDVLVTKDGTIGKVAFVDKVTKPTTLNSGVFVIRPKNKAFDTKYFYYVLMSNHFAEFLSRLTAGSTISHLYQKDFVNYSFPIPTLLEQKAIAQVLSDTDNLIQALEQKLTKKRAIKQGAMQKLLTPKEDWQNNSLGEVVVNNGLVRGPFGGALKKEFFVAKGIKVYEQKNAIYKNIGLGSYYIDKNKYLELKRFEIKLNDFIVSCSGTIGKIYQIPKNAPKGIINQALLKITINTTILNDKYFCHYFGWDKFQEKIIDSTQGGAMKNLIGMSDFKKTIIPAPNLKEQTQIATILSDMDAEIKQIEQKLSKYKMLKQGLMQNLLTGKIRLS